MPANESPDDQVHRRAWDALLDRVNADQFPSSLMLDLLERDMHPEDRPVLVDVLVRKAYADRYPSPTLLHRASRIAR